MFLPNLEYCFPGPSGRAERQTTHSSTPGSDECKRAAHECARDSPSLECRGRQTTEHTGCVVWVAAGTHTETAAQSSLFSPGRVRSASARESPCLTPVVFQQRVTSGSGGQAVPQGWGSPSAEASRRATQHDLTESPVTIKEKPDTCTTREFTCASDVHDRHRTGCARARASARHTHAVSLTHALASLVRRTEHEHGTRSVQVRTE